MRKLAFCVAIIMCLTLIVPVSCCSEEEEENTFIKLLSLLPETAKEERVITIIDYELFRQANGISVYDEDGQRLNREEYFERILAVEEAGSIFGYDILRFGSYWTGCADYILSSPIQDESVGYEITDVDAEINNIYHLSALSWEKGGYLIAQNPPFMIAAVGDLNPEATNDALINRDEWPLWATENYTNEEYQDLVIHSWGDGLETRLHDRYSLPHLDSLGRALPLAVSDGYLFIGSYVDYIKSMIDTRLNETKSLADIPEYVLAAEGMFNLGAIGALIIDEAHTRDILIQSQPFTGSRIRDFLTVGMGPGRDKTGEYMALVLVCENTADVEEGVSLIEEKIEAYNNLCDMSDHLEDVCIYDTEIYAEGRVLHAKLYTESQILWQYWFFDPSAIIFIELIPYL